MRLHRLLIRDFRGVAEREVRFADTGVTLIHGPNEAGKSSLVEAFQLLREVKATSKSQRVAAVCPSDRDVGPFVEAELTVGPYRFVYAKQYHRRPGTTVTVLSPTPVQLTGGQAEAWVTEQFSTHVDVELLGALTVLQASGPRQPSLRDSAAFATALDAASGAAIAPDEPGAQRLAEAIASERARYFTPSGIATGELKEARTRRSSAQNAFVAAESALAEVDCAVARHATETAALGPIVERRSQVAAAHAQLVAEKDRVAHLQSQVRHATVVVDAATVREQQAGAAANGRKRLIERHSVIAQKAAALRGQRDSALAARDALTSEATWLANTVHELAAVYSDRRERKAQAQLAVDCVRESTRYQGLVAKIRQAELIEKDIQDARNRLDANPIDRRALAAIVESERRVERSQAQLTAYAATLRLERLGFADVLVDGRNLGSEPVDVTVGDGTVVEVPGAVRIEVLQRGESARAAADLRAAKAAVVAVCRDAGAQTPEHARELFEQREAIEIELHEAQISLARVLGEQTAAELTELVTQSALRLEDLESAVEPDLLELDVDQAKLHLLAATEGEIAAREQEQVAVKEASLKQQELHRATTDAQVAADRLQHFDSDATELASQLAADRSIATDADVQAAADAAAAERATATDALAEWQAAASQAAVATFAARLAASAADLDAARFAESEARERLAGLVGQLAIFQADGRKEAFDLAATELAAAERELQSLEERSRAVAVLHDTLARHRDARRARVQSPFQHALEELGRDVFGDPLTLTVGDDLTVVARTVDGVTVPFDSLSGGAQEQIGVLSRLACARLVDPIDGAPVIFDDALGHSDQARLTAMASALAAAGKSAQVIVFSCVPGRFDALRRRPGVTEVQLS